MNPIDQLLPTSKKKKNKHDPSFFLLLLKLDAWA